MTSTYRIYRRPALLTLLLASMLFCAAAIPDAQAKARPAKLDPLIGGLYVPPLPDSKPPLILKPPASDAQVAETAPTPPPARIPTVMPPTEHAVGRQNAPELAAAQNYPVRSVGTLGIPLLFR